MTSEQLKEHRESLGLTQQEFADEYGYSKNHISKFERGVTPVPLVLKKALSNEIKFEADLDFMIKVHNLAKEKEVSFPEALFRLAKNSLKEQSK